MKRLMVLGAGYTQTPLYEAAQRLGVHTIAVSTPGDWPGFQLAAEASYTDISDPEAVANAAADLHADGICTCGLDLGMRAIGAAAEANGLVGPSARAALCASNKFEMKKALTRGGVSTARFFMIHTEEELENAMNELPFPVVLKAVDLMGSRGIFRSNTKEEARENFRKSLDASRLDYCLIEEFIEGQIFGVESMIQNGQILYMLPNNIETFIGAVPTPVGHSVPFERPELLETIYRETEKAIRAVGLNNCPVNCDFIMRGDDVYVIELTGRSGATGLSEMTGIYYDINYYEVIVRLALGEDVSGYFAHPGKSYQAALVHTLTAPEQGIVKEIHNENPAADDILDLSFNIEPGEAVQPYTNGRDRIGQVILRGTSLDALKARVLDIESNISIELETSGVR